MRSNSSRQAVRHIDRSRLISGALAALAVTLAVAAYLNTLHNPFVFDDRTEILENESIRTLSDVGTMVRRGITRPLVNLSYAIDYRRTELRPLGYHQTNVLLHALNVLLLFVLVGRLMRQLPDPVEGALAGRPPGLSAFAAAGVFAVHPMMTEAVGYASSRSELLCSVFFLGSVLAFTRAFDRRGPGWVIAGSMLFLLALASRETAVMLPLVVLACDVLRPRRPNEPRRLAWRIHIPLLAIALVIAAARVWVYMRVEHPATSGFQWQYLPVELDVLAKYVSLLLIPVSQTIVHAVYPPDSWLDPRILWGAAVLGLLVWAAVAWWERQPLATFGIVWFLLVQTPAAVLMLLSDRGQPMAEHRIYLASCGFFMVVGAFAGRLSGPQTTRSGLRSRTAWTAGALALVLAVLFAMTVARNRIWADPIALWEDAAAKAPLTYMAQYGVADAYFAVGDCESAAPAYERALMLRPDRPNAYLGLSSCLVELNRADDARLLLRVGIERVPGGVELRMALAGLEEGRGNFGEALRLCREVLTLAPADSRAAACVARSEGALSGF